eukprot:scaffold15311_cov136-Cylindrotheca_fusiformis.AAC.4
MGHRQRTAPECRRQPKAHLFNGTLLTQCQGKNILSIWLRIAGNIVHQFRAFLVGNDVEV